MNEHTNRKKKYIPVDIKSSKSSIFFRRSLQRQCLCYILDDKKWFDVRIAVIYNEILYEEFADLQDHVVYLDVFSIFVANNMQLLHPTGQAMHNQIQQLLAYLC